VGLCDFGKKLKKRLVDIDKTQTWLISEITKKTGLYMDSSYLHRILTGQNYPTKIISAICEILDITTD